MLIDVSFQGLAYFSGYLAKWSGAKELGTKSQPNPIFGIKEQELTNVDATESLAPWIFMISKGGLTVPVNQFLLDVERMDKEFNDFHGVASLDKGEKIFDRLTDRLVVVFKGK